MLPGSYELKITAAGFRAYVETDVIASINNITRVSVKLEVGGTTEQITVAASAAMLQSDKADVHVELNSKEVMDMPLAKQRKS